MHDIKAIKEKLSTYKVLIVDDEEEISKVIARTFENFFAEVVCAIDGQDALEMVSSKGPFDMVLTDISMPNITGIQLLKELRSIDKKAFIILMSGAFDEYQQDIQKDDILVH